MMSISKMEFKPTKKQRKEILNITIDKCLMDMLKKIMEIYDVNLSTATSDILNYFREEAWEKGEVELPEKYGKEITAEKFKELIKIKDEDKMETEQTKTIRESEQ